MSMRRAGLLYLSLIFRRSPYYILGWGRNIRILRSLIQESLWTDLGFELFVFILSHPFFIPARSTLAFLSLIFHDPARSLIGLLFLSCIELLSIETVFFCS